MKEQSRVIAVVLLLFACIAFIVVGQWREARLNSERNNGRQTQSVGNVVQTDTNMPTPMKTVGNEKVSVEFSPRPVIKDE